MPGLKIDDKILDLGVEDIALSVVPLPFFMQNSVFQDFRYENYTWDLSKKINVLLRTKRSTGVQVPSPPSEAQIQPEPTTNGIRRGGGIGDENGDGMGGCPLECSFDPNENFDEALNALDLFETTFAGFQYDKSSNEVVTDREARRLLGRVKLALEEKKLVQLDGVDFSLPIFIPCDPTQTSSRTVMWGYNSERCIDIRLLGPFNRDSPELTMDSLMGLHKQIRNSIRPPSINRQVHVIYEKTHGEFKAEGKLFMEFVWNDPKSIFEAPPVSNARVKLVVQPCFGDANPFLIQMWAEMAILDKTVSQIGKIDMNMELQRSHMTVLGTSDADSRSEVVNRMLYLLNQPSVPNWKKGIEYSDSLETVLKRVIDVDRSDADFTDQVWLILKDCTSLHELYECVHAMLSSIESKVYRPYLLPSNKTLLGALLTKMVNNEIINFRTELTVRLAVEITLDCGLNKLFKDYCFILGMCHLAEPDEMIEFCPRSDNFEKSLTELKKLHCILEVLCLTRERVALSMSELEMQTRKLLKYFKSNTLEQEMTFHFDVPLSSVAPAVFGLHPVYWKLRVESSTMLTTTRNSMILSRDIYLDYAKKLFTLSDGSISRGYYLYICRECSPLQS